MYVYVCIYVCTYIHTYLYVCVWRERKREREGELNKCDMKKKKRNISLLSFILCMFLSRFELMSLLGEIIFAKKCFKNSI